MAPVKVKRKFASFSMQNQVLPQHEAISPFVSFSFKEKNPLSKVDNFSPPCLHFSQVLVDWEIPFW